MRKVGSMALKLTRQPDGSWAFQGCNRAGFLRDFLARRNSDGLSKWELWRWNEGGWVVLFDRLSSRAECIVTADSLMDQPESPEERLFAL